MYCTQHNLVCLIYIGRCNFKIDYIMRFEDYFKTRGSLNKQLNAPFLNERISFIDRKIAAGLQPSSIRSLAYLLRPIAIMASKHSGYVPINVIWQLVHPAETKSRCRSLCLLDYSIPFLQDIHKIDPIYNDNSLVINKLIRFSYFRVLYLSAPNLVARENFLQFKFKNGTSPKTFSEIIPMLIHIQNYLQLFPLRTVTQLDIITAANRYSSQNKSPNYSFMIFLRVAKDWLSFLNLLIKEDKLSDINDIDKLWCYLNDMYKRGLSEKTVRLNKNQLGQFMMFAMRKDASLNYLKPETIDEYFRQLTDRGVVRRTIYPLSSSIRVFLRFCEENKWCKVGISSFVKAPRVYHFETLPYPVPWENIKELIKNVDTERPVDIRSRAMYLLFAIYGLRSSEVTGLRLTDINWEKETFHLHRSKNSAPQILPLFPIVGNAIIKYLQSVRNNEIKSEYVFLALKAPYKPLSGAAIYRFLNVDLKSQNLQLKHYGAHSLRYGCATHLINSGHTFKEIADLLGHKMLETTKIYAKVDMSSLSKVSDMNWEGLL